MKLPKLYRVVYIKLEWVTDECWDGEHHQSTGYVYPRARVVLKNGVKFWQIIDMDLALQALYCDEIDSLTCDGVTIKWTESNPEIREFAEMIKQNPRYYY